MAHIHTRARPHREDTGGGSDADPTRIPRRHCRVRTQAVARMHVHDAASAGTIEADEERAEVEKRKREAVPSGAAAAGDEEGSARGRLKKKQRVGARRRSATRSGKRWTVEEDASLLEQCKKGVSPSQIVIPHRTARSIDCRLQNLRKQAAALGDELDDSIAAALAQRFIKWTATEDASLLEQCKSGVPPSKIVIPHRTRDSIESRLPRLRKQAAALGDSLDEEITAALARRCVKWTAREDASLLEQHKRDVCVTKIVIPNRTASSIAHRLQNLRKQAAALGDKVDGTIATALAKRCVKWTTAEDASLLEQCKKGVPPCKIVILNRTRDSINSRRTMLRKQAAAVGAGVDEDVTAALAKRQVHMRWTAEEDASLLEQRKRGVLPSKIVIPNRTSRSIGSRICTLRKQAAALGTGLDEDIAAALARRRVYVRWTAAEDASLLEQHKRGVQPSKIVIPNRSASSIEARLRRLHK